MACLTLTNPTKRCKGAGEQCPDESLGLTPSGSFSVKPSLWLLVSSHSYRLAIRHTQNEKIAALISIGYLLHPSIVTVLLQNSISALAGHRRGANFDDQVRWRRP
jgi:hypothetical protein